MSLPHIAFVASQVWPVLARDVRVPMVGGAEVQQTLQMRALQRAGWRVSVLTRDHGQPALVDCDGIAVHRIPAPGRRGWPGLRFFHPRLSDIVRLLYRVGPDLVFVQTASEEVAAAALYARLARRLFVFAGASDRDFEPGALPGMPGRHAAAYRLGLRAADAVLVQNQAQQALLSRLLGREGHLVQNGYEEPGARSARHDGLVLWAATVKPLKRPDLFIELARRLPQRRFVMVGGAEPAPGGAAFVEQVALQARGLPNLTLAGHVPFHEVGAWFDRAAVVVNTSDYEGLPNTFVQAWLRGAPTLSFVRPESAPGRTGTIACADVDDMARRLAALLDDEPSWQAASMACRRHFETHHTMEVALRRYLEIFEGVLGGRASAAPAGGQGFLR
jgi:glycosyltransferase involved in cell wall biosynthesis